MCVIERVSEIAKLQGKSLRHTNYRARGLEITVEILLVVTHHSSGVKRRQRLLEAG